MDLVYQCILTALFKSHGHRHDVVFHTILNGPPNPPLHLQIKGDELFDARTDERTWESILKKVLQHGSHPGITVQKGSYEQLVKKKHREGTNIFVLEEKGEDILEVDYGQDAMFILGDHIGLPKIQEKFALRYGKKVTLGEQKYLAASCVDIVNFLLDNYVSSKYNRKR
jgi:tRNA (pseudouridine54-N1)-methyltransferase